MRTAALVNLFLLCVSVPTVVLRSFPGYDGECSSVGGRCVDEEECSSQLEHLLSYTKNCEDGKLCCLTGQQVVLKRIDSYDTNIEDVPVAEFATKTSNLSSTLVGEAQPEVSHSNALYSVDYQPGGLEEIRIVNVNPESNRAKPKIIPKKLVWKESPEESDENTIVFPENSEEKLEDRVQYIQKLYRKFAMDFKKYNHQNREGQIMSKRKLKHAVGYKSAKYCKLYEKHVSDNSLLATPLLPNLLPIMMKNNHCSKPLPLIVGGTNTTKAEFPHMAGLGYDRGQWIDFLCGGSLISDRYVLTAAHCANTKWGPPIMVRLGTRNLITDEGQNMDVEEVIIHPDYKEPSGYNDIALVKIVPGVKMGRFLRPACLPPPNTVAGNPGRLLTATGWGRTGFGLYSSPNLQKVSLKVMDNVTCEEQFLGGRRTLRLPEGVQDTMLCAAGHLDSSHDTCQGDSGGPLQTLTRRTKCVYEIIGITSFGKLCGTGLPAIYTRVSSYIHWIEDIVWPS